MATTIADLEARILMQVDGGQQIVNNLQLLRELGDKAKIWRDQSIFPVKSDTEARKFLKVAADVDRLTQSYERAYQVAAQSGASERALALLTAQYADTVALLTKNFDPLIRQMEKAKLEFGVVGQGMNPVLQNMLAMSQAVRNLDDSLLRRRGGFAKILPGKEELSEIKSAYATFEDLANKYLRKIKEMMQADAGGSRGLLSGIRNALVPSSGSGGGSVSPIDPQLAAHLNAVGQFTAQLSGHTKVLNDLMAQAAAHTKRLAEEEAKRAAALGQAEARARAAQEAMNAQTSASQRQAQASQSGAQAAERQASAMRNLWEAMKGATNASQAWGVLNSNLSGAMWQLGQFATMASGPLGSALGRLANLSFITQGGIGTAAAVGGISVFTAGLGRLAGEMIRVERIIGPVRELHMSLAKAAGEDGVKNFETLTGVMVKYGLSIENLSKPIARLKLATDGTLLGGDRFKGFLEDFAAVSTKFALPQEAIAGMAKAFEQMISKGTVQAEEFRQQLGDRLPAAARIGLLTFQELTGNSQAKFEDFMNAMKNRQLESTRFLDIFMLKLKETFNVTNAPADNLNAAYGRLAASRDLAINKLDQAIGVTKAWGTALNGLASSMQVLGDSASTLGPLIQLALGAGALIAVSKLSVAMFATSGALAGIVTGVGVLGKAMLAFRVAALAVGGSLAYIFGKQTYDSIAGAAEKIIGETKRVAIDSSMNVVQAAQSAVSAGGTFTGQSFKVKFDDEMKKTFKDPATLIAEISRYFAHVRDGLRNGTKITVDFDFVGAIDAALVDLNRKLGDRGILTEVMKKDGSPRAVREWTRIYEEAYDDMGKRIISRSQNLTARLHKGASEELNQSILKMDELFRAADAAAQVVSGRQAARQILETQQQQQRLQSLRDQYIKLQGEMSKINEAMSSKGPTSGIQQMMQAAQTAAPILQGMATILGIIAAVNLAGLALGFRNVGTAVASLGGLLTSARAKILGLVAAGAALGMFINSSKAAAEGADALAKRAQEIQGEMALKGEQFTGWTRLGQVLGDATTRADALEEQLKSLRLERDAAEKSWLANKMGASNNRVTDTLRDLTGVRPPADIERDIRKVEQALVEYRSVVRTLKPELDRYKEGIAADQQALERQAEASLKVKDAQDKVRQSLDELSGRRAAFEQGGAEGLKFYDTMQSLWKQMAGGVLSYGEALKSTDPEVQRLVALVKGLAANQRQLALDTERSTNEMRKFKRMTSEQAEGIIARSEAIMEGMGSKTGAALKTMIKDVDDYRTALTLMGASQQEVAAKTQEFTLALQMQAAGINMAALQFKPYEAMQRGFTTFTDSLVDLLGKGELNAKSFKKAFSDMAMSIASDMLKMIIKANILRPLMASIYGGFGNFGGGTAGMEMGNPFGSLFGGFFAKGDVFDGATAFGMGGGKIGVMAEAGPEAVMPLRRGPDGSLGVQVVGSGGAASSPTYNVTYNVSTPDTAGFARSETQMAAMLTRMSERGRRNS